METIFRKWQVLLLQGFLLIIIGFIFFNNPEEILAIISLWVGILTLATGILGLIAYFATRSEGSDRNSLWWSIITILLGLAMISKVGLTMKVITIFFGCWIFLTGIFLFSEGWNHRTKGILSWIMITGGILSVVAGVLIVFDIRIGAVWISTLLGVQALIAGISFILLALLKRKVLKEIAAHSFR